jgi:hypothetical protein
MRLNSVVSKNHIEDLDPMHYIIQIFISRHFQLLTLISFHNHEYLIHKSDTSVIESLAYYNDFMIAEYFNLGPTTLRLEPNHIFILDAKGY